MQIPLSNFCLGADRSAVSEHVKMRTSHKPRLLEATSFELVWAFAVKLHTEIELLLPRLTERPALAILFHLETERKNVRANARTGESSAELAGTLPGTVIFGGYAYTHAYRLYYMYMNIYI